MVENKRFKHSITLQGEDEIWDSQTDVYFRVCGALNKLNELHEENKELKADNKRLVKFILSKGYGLKDYLDWLRKEVWK